MEKNNYLMYWVGSSLSKRNNKDRDFKMENIFVDLIENGLPMNFITEKVMGENECGIISTNYVTSFMDMTLNEALKYSKKNNLIGLALSREFICELTGQPVIYLKNDNHDFIAPIFYNISSYLQANNEELYRQLSLVSNYIKPMSEYNQADFINYNKKEWRIVWNSRLIDDPRITETTINNTKEYRIQFPMNEFKAAVFPNSTIKNRLFDNGRLMPYLSQIKEIIAPKAK